MSATRPLTKNGKPMRALRALAGTNAAEPQIEYGVYLSARSDKHDSSSWHAPLATLVARGFAERCGSRGGYEWFITDAGRAFLAEIWPAEFPAVRP